MPTGLALDRTEFCALLSLLSARSVYGIDNLDPQASTASAGLKKLGARKLLSGEKADRMLRLMSVVVAPRFIVVAEAATGAASLHYLDPPVCVSLEGGLTGFRVGLVGSIDLLARRVLRFEGFDPALPAAAGEPFTVEEAAVSKRPLAVPPPEVPAAFTEALSVQAPTAGGQLLVLRGTADLARKARLLARPGGAGYLLHRPDATQPRLRVEALCATSMSTVISGFITWLTARS